MTSVMTIAEMEDTLQELSDNQRYHLLKHHSQPCKNYVFPSQFEGGCNRSFQIGWLEEFSWLVYSSALDGTFCITCALFANPRSGLGILVNKPFIIIEWRKKSDYITPHATKKYHVDAWKAANDFIQKIENPQLTLSSVTQSNCEENSDRNFGILKCIIEAVLFCGRQCIAFRTRNESNLDGSVNPGNFLAFLKMVARHDDVLMEHLTSRAMNRQGDHTKRNCGGNQGR